MNSPLPKEPLFFLKPTTSYLQKNGCIILPRGSDVDHEVELGVVIGKRGKGISKQDVEAYISGYVIALDMTARTFQGEAKAMREPWTRSKGYDTFTPIGKYIPKPCGNVDEMKVLLRVNDTVRQVGNVNEMLFSVHELIAYVSKVMTLEEGDLILTGTPEGVGPVKEGDTLVASLYCGNVLLDDATFTVQESK